MLSEANLQGADLRMANLRGADLRGANLSRSNLTRANLYKVDLRAANLRAALLGAADLNAANSHAQKIAITVGVYLEQCIAEILVVGERVHTKRVINSDVELLVKHRMDHTLIFFSD